MTTPSYTRSLVCAAKRLKISSPAPSIALQHNQHRRIQQQTQRSLPEDIQKELSSLRLPRAVQATYLSPLKRTPTQQRIPVCNLQLRSYSVRNLELFADFALRAAYYLNLPASGPVPLPRITERWTVPRSNFIFKKSQENFERRTLRRLVQIQNGDVESVGVWLGCLRKWCFHGVGMKADVFEWSGLDVSAELDKEAERIEALLGQTAELAGMREGAMGNGEMQDFFLKEPFKAQWGSDAPMSANESAMPASRRIDKEVVGGGGGGKS